MNTLIDNIKFVKNDGIWYVDGELNIEFIVPDGWKEMKFDKKDSNFNAKFISEDGKKMKIQYMRADMWSNIPELESEGFTRKDINNSLFSEADITEQFGTDVNSVKKKKYGKNEYFICNSQITASNEKNGLKIHLRQLYKMGILFHLYLVDRKNMNSIKSLKKCLKA